MDKHSKILVLGSRGLVGSGIVRTLKRSGYENILSPTTMDLNLLDRNATLNFFRHHRPEYVFIAAAKVGGIWANQNYPVDFTVQNLHIELNSFEASFATGVKKLLFLGSSCIYPKESKIPITEDSLLTGALEPTNEGYALAKILGVRLCTYYRRQHGCNYIAAMPTNTFGPFDNFDPIMGHMLPALIYKFHRAKLAKENSVTVWGTGNPRREMIYIDDLADALIFLMKNYNSSELINVGTGVDFSIREIAEVVKKAVGFEGNLVFDTTKPDGVFRKVMDVKKIHDLGWKSKHEFNESVAKTYEWYKEQHAEHGAIKIHPSYKKDPLLIKNQRISDWIKLKMIDTRLLNKSLDDPDIPSLHRSVILKKPFLQSVYKFHYQKILDIEKELSKTFPQNSSLELGSGGGFLKTLLPHVITSDVYEVEGVVDRIENAYKLNFPDNSLKAIYLVGVLHHLGDVRAFFREARRVLIKGGCIVMMEPHMSWFGKFFFQKLHHESNDMMSPKWEFPQIGPLSSANTALPYILFDRDHKRFEAEFPDFVITERDFHTFLLYGLSGGVSLRWSTPGFLFPVFRALEALLKPWMQKYLGTMQTVVLKKES